MNSPSSNGVVHFHRKQKLKAINGALTQIDVDAALLRQLAITECGLIRDEYRRRAWPSLLASNTCFLAKQQEQSPVESEQVQTSQSRILDSVRIEQLQNHPEYSQVFMDVHRTLARFPPNVSDERRIDLQSKLTPLIAAILDDNPNFKYYQGFHDVCLTVLLVFDDVPPAYDICSHLASSFFRPFLVQSLDDACRSLENIYPIIFAVDPELYVFLRRSHVGVHFAISWTLTWFAHVVDEYKTVVRLYDLFLASHPLMPVYLTASIVLFRGSEILATECDMAYVHSLLSKMPKSLPLEALIADAQDLFVQHPPSKLPELKRKMVSFKRGANDKRFSTFIPKKSTVGYVMWSLAAAAAAIYVYNHYPHIR